MADCHERGEPRPIQWRAREDGLEEAVMFVPGYNCTKKGWHGHGVHGMEIRWMLRGPAGATHFLLFTEWTPGKLWPGHGLDPFGRRPAADMYPMGTDLGYHARRPHFEGQEPTENECPIIGGMCFYDGSGMQGYELAPVFVREGESVIWAVLETWYQRLVDEETEAHRAATDG